MASRAFTARFMSTWSTWPWSARTQRAFGERRTSSSMSSPMRGRRRVTELATTLLRSSTTGWRICLRLNVRSRLVRADARLIVVRIWPRSARAGDVALQVVGEDARVARDDGEQVVEVVGDAARQAPDGLHLLRVQELLLRRVELLQAAFQVPHQPCLSPRRGCLVREGGEHLQVLGCRGPVPPRPGARTAPLPPRGART